MTGRRLERTVASLSHWNHGMVCQSRCVLQQVIEEPCVRPCWVCATPSRWGRQRAGASCDVKPASSAQHGVWIEEVPSPNLCGAEGDGCRAAVLASLDMAYQWPLRWAAAWCLGASTLSTMLGTGCLQRCAAIDESRGHRKALPKRGMRRARHCW